jgi:hypothetical protein
MKNKSRIFVSFRFVKDRRQSISPNLNFVGQLYEFEKQLNRSLSPFKTNVGCHSGNSHQQVDYLKHNVPKLYTRPSFFFESSSESVLSPSTALESFRLNSPSADRSINDLYSTFATRTNPTATASPSHPASTVMFRKMNDTTHSFNNKTETSRLPKSSTLDSMLCPESTASNRILSNLVLNFRPRQYNSHCGFESHETVKQPLTRPSSIQLCSPFSPIRETPPCPKADSPINETIPIKFNSQISTTSSSSSSATWSTSIGNQIDSPIFVESSKKLKLSPPNAKDDSSAPIKPQDFTFQTSHDDTALLKTQVEFFDFLSNKKTLTSSKLVDQQQTAASITSNWSACRPGKSLKTIENRIPFENGAITTTDCSTPQPLHKLSSPSSNSSSSSLHGSIEKMIEVS